MMNNPAEGRVVLFSLATWEEQGKEHFREQLQMKELNNLLHYTLMLRRWMRVYQVHVVVMAPGHEHVVQPTPLGVGPKLCVELRVVVVRVLLQILQIRTHEESSFSLWSFIGPIYCFGGRIYAIGVPWSGRCIHRTRSRQGKCHLMPWDPSENHI